MFRRLLAGSILIGGLASPLAALSSAGAPQSPANLDRIPWNERTWEQRALQSSYKDEFTFKHRQIFNKDPYVWALSKRFAEKFGMPSEWVDPELQGALAVAWRITTIGQESCGYGGVEDACRPIFECQMDVYVDSKANIPWRFDDVRRDFLQQGLSSSDYVPWRLPSPRRARYVFEDARLGSKGWPFYNTGWQFKDGKDIGFFISYFDRDYTPDITLLGFRACPSHVMNGAASVRFFTDEEQVRTGGVVKNFVHTVSFSESFMRKITEIYRVAWKKNSQDDAAYQQMKARAFGR